VDALIGFGEHRIPPLIDKLTLAHRIGDDAAMIEREIERIPVGDERRRCGIVSGVRVMAGCLYPIGDTDHVAPAGRDEDRNKRRRATR